MSLISNRKLVQAYRRRWSSIGSRDAYQNRILSEAPIAYWPLSEKSGTNADNLEGTAARDGTFARNVTTMGVGTGIGDGNTAPDFDGTNDYVDVFSNSFRDAFDGSLGTALIWLRMSGAGVWSDGQNRYFLYLVVDANNYITMSKGNNVLPVLYKAGIAPTMSWFIPSTSVDWMSIGLTWSLADDEVKIFYNGSLEVTFNGVGAWAGNLTLCYLGSIDAVPNNPTDGYIAHAAVWTRVLSEAKMESLGSP